MCNYGAMHHQPLIHSNSGTAKIFPMDPLAVDNLLVDKKPASMRIGGEGIDLRIGGEQITIFSSALRTLDVFRGARGWVLRLVSEDRTVDISNVHESQLARIRSAATTHFGLAVTNVELETLSTTRGNLSYTNGLVSLMTNKQIFSIPRTEIKSITELENELVLQLEGAEIVLSTQSSVPALVGATASSEICIVNDINCLNPRSRCTLLFFSDYFVLRGSSYDHSIFYSDVEEIFYLKRDTLFYVVVRLGACIVQGQTRYDSIVFLVGDRPVEVAASDSRLRPFYSGDQAEVLLDILEALIKIKAQESVASFKCTSKVFEGHLYLLPGSLQFLPKSISIPLGEISYVEFSRINLSMAQAKTFDMTVFASKVHCFKGIPKDSFGDLEVFLAENSIKMVSEVIEESESKSDYESDGSNLSNIIDSGDE